MHSGGDLELAVNRQVPVGFNRLLQLHTVRQKGPDPVARQSASCMCSSQTHAGAMAAAVVHSNSCTACCKQIMESARLRTLGRIQKTAANQASGPPMSSFAQACGASRLGHQTHGEEQDDAAQS
jgi:hypothetical protein